jgi:DNA-binding PadR family transcriptional regulator
MAALWAHREFGFEPRPQNWYAKKLAIGLGEMGRLLTQLEQANCVELVSHRHSRHNLYKITDLGKRQIEDWVEAHYGDDLFASAFKEKDTTPDPNKVARILERFRASLRDELSH